MRPVLQQARPLPVCGTLSLKNKPSGRNKHAASAFLVQIRDICVHAAFAALNVVSGRDEWHVQQGLGVCFLTSFHYAPALRHRYISIFPLFHSNPFKGLDSSTREGKPFVVVIGGTGLIESKVIEKLKVPLGEACPRPHRFRRMARPFTGLIPK
jgi:hypothetical protein